MDTLSTPLCEVFRENVLLRMKVLGETQTSLAKKSGLQRSYISQILNGHRRPGLSSIQALANGLDVDPSELLKKFANSA
jgi:transcriptional regulator with XRE-family HTH domain